MFDAIVDGDLSRCEYCKIPMVSAVYGHHKELTFVEALFLQNSLDLGISLLEGARCKV